MASKADSIQKQFERALEAILARVFISASEPQPMAVAYSGGLDSSVLLRWARDYAKRTGIKLIAFHVHHGLSANADAWLAHCQRECDSLNVLFEARHVQVDRKDKRGMEGAARELRYAALGELCRELHVPLLLTAHHQDDQAETILLQLLRGAGLPGLSGMDSLIRAPDLLGSDNLWLGRPMLGLTRAGLQAFAEVNGVSYIEDESNADVRHPRNALRQQIMPQLEAIFPACQENIVRSARHIESAQKLMAELAQHDLAICQQENQLDVAYLRALSNERVDNVLRHWMSESGFQMPSTAWLNEARTQLLWSREDAQVCVSYEGYELRRYRNSLTLAPVVNTPDYVSPHAFRWHGETEINFPEFGGTLSFEKSEKGIDIQWLKEQNLRIEFHQGGGRLKLVSNRPTRSLKEHFQESGIPSWERRILPVVYSGKTLVFVAGIGQDCRIQASEEGRNIRLVWEQKRG